MNFVVIFSGQGLQSIQHIQEVQAGAEEYALNLENLTDQLASLDLQKKPETIFENQFAQPFIFTLQYLRWQKIMAQLPEPELLAGYSLGEASAFCCSANMDFSQSLQLISKRAEFMSQQSPENSALVSIQGLNSEQLLPLLKNTQTEISIKLNEAHYIIGGTDSELEQLLQSAQSHGAQNASKLKVSIPSHTSFLKKAADDFSTYLHQQSLNRMNFSLISASHGQKYSLTQDAVSILSEQIDHALNWYNCMETIEEYQPDVILEIGPGNALTRMINQVMPNVHARSIDDFSSMDGVKNWISKFM